MGRHFSKVRGPRAYWAPQTKKSGGSGSPGSDAYACTPGKGVCGGANFFGSGLLQPVHNVCIFLSAFFIVKSNCRKTLAREISAMISIIALTYTVRAVHSDLFNANGINGKSQEAWCTKSHDRQASKSAQRCRLHPYWYPQVRPGSVMAAAH